MDREFKAFPLLELKSEDAGRFTGYASTYAKDFYGDRILPGAFAQSIRDQKGKIPLFYDHLRSLPIGFSTDLAEDAKGLYIEGQLSLDSTHGRDAHALLKTAKSVDYRMGLSIGFITSEVEVEHDGTRVIKSLELFETSLTPFPVNRQARVEALKSIRNIEQLLRDVAGCSPEQAKRTLSFLRPYLSVDADGKSLQSERDVTEREQVVSRAVVAIGGAFKEQRA